MRPLSSAMVALGALVLIAGVALLFYRDDASKVPVAPEIAPPARAPETHPGPLRSEPRAIVAAKAAVPGIAGVVVDERGRPLAGATVALEESQPADEPWPEGRFDARKPIGARTADAAGAFVIPDVEPGRYDVLAEAPGFGWRASRGIPVGDAGAAGIRIELAPHAGFVGRVVGPDGAPVAGAEVEVLHSVSGGWAKIRSGLGIRRTTDVAGAFWFPGAGDPALVALDIRARKAGVGSGVLMMMHGPPGPGPFEVRLQRERSVTIAFVPDDGSPPPSGLRFIAADYGAHVTDSLGRAVLACVREGRKSVVIRLDDETWVLAPRKLVVPGRRPDLFDHADAGDCELVVPLSRPGWVSGTVIDRETRTPVPQVAIRAGTREGLFELVGLSSSAELPKTAVSDAEGRFLIPGLPRHKVLLAPADPAWAFATGTVTVPLDTVAAAENVVIEVVPGATVEGLVVDERGDPATGVRVSVIPAEGGGRMRTSEDPSSTSDPAGAFAVPGVRPGKCQIFAEPRNARLVWSEPFEVRPGETVRDVRVIAQRGIALVVDVVGADGRRMNGLRLTLTQAGGGVVGEAVTGPDGCAVFESVAATAVVIEPDPAALREGVAPDDESRKPVSIDRFQTARVALHLRRVALLRGRVLLEDGSALGGGTAVLRELQPPGVHGVNRSGALFGTEPTGPRPPPTARKDATIGPDGAFEITVASLGDWEVTEVTRVVPVAGGAPRFERFVPCAKAVLARDADSVVTVRPSSAAPPGSR